MKAKAKKKLLKKIKKRNQNSAVVYKFGKINSINNEFLIIIMI